MEVFIPNKNPDCFSLQNTNPKFDNFVIEKTYNTKIMILISILFVFLGGMLMLLSKEYLFYSVPMHCGKITIKSILSSFCLINEFLPMYYEYIIKKHWIILFILASIFFSSIFIKNSESKRVITFSFIFTCSLLFVFTLFIFSRGEFNEYGYASTFTLSHHDFPVLIRLELLMILMFALSGMMKIIENNRKVIIGSAFFILIGVITFLSIFDYKPYISDFIDYNYNYRKEKYILDKMLLHYYKTSKKPILSDNMLGDNQGWLEYHHMNYFDKVYGIIPPKLSDVEWVNRETALEEYYKNGGSFTEYELSELKFSTLYDIKNLKNTKLKFYPPFGFHTDYDKYAEEY